MISYVTGRASAWKGDAEYPKISDQPQPEKTVAKEETPTESQEEKWVRELIAKETPKYEKLRSGSMFWRVGHSGHTEYICAAQQMKHLAAFMHPTGRSMPANGDITMEGAPLRRCPYGTRAMLMLLRTDAIDPTKFWRDSDVRSALYTEHARLKTMGLLLSSQIALEQSILMYEKLSLRAAVLNTGVCLAIAGGVLLPFKYPALKRWPIALGLTIAVPSMWIAGEFYGNCARNMEKHGVQPLMATLDSMDAAAKSKSQPFDLFGRRPMHFAEQLEERLIEALRELECHRERGAMECAQKAAADVLRRHWWPIANFPKDYAKLYMHTYLGLHSERIEYDHDNLSDGTSEICRVILLSEGRSYW